MMGFGAYGNGGPYPYSSSSSPSSLSALAPPFTVDRSVPKPISSPLVDVTEPPFVAPLNSSLHNWLPSHPPTTGSHFFANPTPEFNSVPSSNAYRYAAGVQTAADPSNTNLPHLNTITTAASNAFTYDQSMDVVAPSFVAKPYYPSYLSPTIHGDRPLVVPDQPSYDWLSTTHFAPLDGSSHKNYTQRPSDSKDTAQWSGLWNGQAEWEQGKKGEFDGSFCSKSTDVSGSFIYKNFTELEPLSSNGLNSCEEASRSMNTLAWERHGGSVSAEHLGGKSVVGKHSNFFPADFSKTFMGSDSVVPETHLSGSVSAEHLGGKSVVGKHSKFIHADFPKPFMGSNSVFPETHLKAPSSQFVTKSINCKSSYSASSEKRQHDAILDDFSSISKSYPAFVSRLPAIGTKSSEPETGFCKRLNFRSDAADRDHGDYHPSSVQESHLPKSSEGKVFDSTQLGIHLGTDDRFSVESLARNKELSNNRSINKDAWDHMFKVKPGLQNYHVSTDGSNAALNANENLGSFLSSSENVDPNNPAVDSPCWKGVPGCRFSPFEASEDGIPEQIKKLEDCDGLNIQMALVFPLNAGETPIKKTVEYDEFGWPAGLTFPLNSVANSVFGECKLDDTVKTTYCSETSHDGGPERYKDAHKSGNGDKSFGLFEPSHIIQQGCGEGGLTTEVKHTTWSCAADVNSNTNDTSEYGSSHVPSQALENVLSSEENAATKLSKPNGEEYIAKVDVQMLVNTMNSLSELLRINCSNGSCQLKKNDLEALKAVIDNLNICLSKNVEKCLPMQESSSFQKNIAQYNGELSEHHKVVSADSSLSASAPDIQNQGIGSVSVKGEIDMVKEDKMTQAIKKILSENFCAEEADPQALLYKNLWLEAEAALCSVNYKARFDRVKIEMDKCKADNSKDMMKQSRSEVSPDSNLLNQLTPEAQGCPTSDPQGIPILSQEDDVMSRFHILRGLAENSDSIDADQSSSKLSPEYNRVEKIALDANDSQSSGISLQDSPKSSTAGATNDSEASVMARFRILRDRIENSKFVNAGNVEEPSSYKVSVEPKIDVIAPDTARPEFNIQDSPFSITTSQANDCEASVMSRFHILKSRADNCSYMHQEGQQLPQPKIDVIAPDTSDSLMPEFNIPDSPISSTSSQANDCEASVMSRLDILKSRVDNSSSMHTEGQQLPENVGLGYAGKRNPWSIIRKRSQGGSSDLKEQPILQSHKADSSEGTVKEFHLFVENDPLAQYHRMNRPANLLPAGSSSDWEHVMKEEIWGQN